MDEARAPCWRHRRRICAPARLPRSRSTASGSRAMSISARASRSRRSSRSDAETVVVRASAAADAASGPRAVSVGDAEGPACSRCTRRSTFVTVEPAYNIARVGGGGGPIPPVPAQFEAVAWLHGADGEAGTDDDVEIGAMPAAWKVQNFDEVAQALDDTAFAGEMQANGAVPAGRGRAQPGAAVLDQQRRQSQGRRHRRGRRPDGHRRGPAAGHGPALERPADPVRRQRARA